MFKFLQIYDHIINPNNINFIDFEHDDEEGKRSSIYIHFNNGETKTIRLNDYQDCSDVLSSLNKCITNKKSITISNA